MLSKLLKYDFKKNMRWMWILFVSTLAVAGIARGFKELGTTIAFFKVVGIFFESVFYALAVNSILQPFLRNFLNFYKSFYSDESYLTHTLPVTKKQLINSKFITAIIEISLGFICLVLSLLIMFASPTMFDTLKLLLSTIIIGEFSVVLLLVLFILLVIVEFLMFISIIFLSIVIAYRAREKRILKTFLIAMGFAFMFLSVLAVVMVIVLSINKINLLQSLTILPINALLSVLIVGIVVYSLAIALCYFLTQREFKKGVNVD